MTHWVSYAPENLGKDQVTSACGKLISIESFSATPTCPDPRCQCQALAHKAKL